jgi:hypothetical protein
MHAREETLAELLAVTCNLWTLKWHWYHDNGVNDRATVTTIIHLDRLITAMTTVRETLCARH